ncbi:MAG: HEAT repeat domain-containing protein, partial [Candidatus Marinimicrobia bacterium]|nr:HEAT repeat domain-containing protein [Candidatus Neomarinimicrobiota bacterium]
MFNRLQNLVLVVLLAILSCTSCSAGGVDAMVEQPRWKKSIADFESKDPEVRIRAIKDLLNVDLFDRDLASEFTKDISKPFLNLINVERDPEVLISALRASTRLQISNFEINPILLDITERENDIRLQVEAIRAMNFRTSDFEYTIPFLEEFFNDESQFIRAASLYKLGGNVFYTDKIIPYLLEGLKDRSPVVQETAAYVISAKVFGQSMRGAKKNKYYFVLPELKRILQSDSCDLRTIAAIATAYIDPDDKEITSRLIEGLDNLKYRHLILHSYAYSGMSPDPAVDRIIDILDSPDPFPTLGQVLDEFEDDMDIRTFLRENCPESVAYQLLSELNPDRVELDKRKVFMFGDYTFIAIKNGYP